MGFEDGIVGGGQRDGIIRAGAPLVWRRPDERRAAKPRCTRRPRRSCTAPWGRDPVFVVITEPCVRVCVIERD